MHTLLVRPRALMYPAIFSGGFGELFSSWQLYAMIAVGVFGLFLVQSALNAGPLIAAQPGLTLSDPIASILWGVLAFHEQVRTGAHLVLAVVSGLVMTGAVVMLARSPLLSQDRDVSSPERREVSSPAAT